MLLQVAIRNGTLRQQIPLYVGTFYGHKGSSSNVKNCIATSIYQGRSFQRVMKVTIKLYYHSKEIFINERYLILNYI